MSRARILADYVSSGDELALKAPIAGPTFTGTVAIPNVANLETAVVANTAKVTNSTNASDLASGTVATARIPAGCVVQVVGHAINETAFTGHSTVLNKDITTTKLNNKVFVTVDMQGYKSVGGTTNYFSAYITGGDLGSADSGHTFAGGTGYGIGINIRKANGMTKEDVPGAVGTYTYGLYLYFTGTQTWNVRAAISLMEVQV